MKIPVIPDNAPFTPDQRAWLNGYLAGLFSHTTATTVAPSAPAIPTQPLLVLYGSQTGTAEQLAKRLATESKKYNFAPTIRELNACPIADLQKETHALIVTSTWGDGEPPDNATQFWANLNSADAPRLENLNFAVLALGDKNYSDFCGAGKKFDARLEQLGAKRLHERTDCDTDYEADAKTWVESLWPKIAKTPAPAAANSVSPASESTPPAPALAAYGRNNPFAARLLNNRKLNAAGSAKDTRHIEISLKDSGLKYEVGDALGVVPMNCPELVSELLAALRCDGEEAVKSPQGNELPLRKALQCSYVITQIAPALLEAFADRSKSDDLKSLLAPARKPDLDKYLYGREIIDLFLTFPNVAFAPHEFVSYLRKLQPRLYSISSSPKAHLDEVHLTVGTVRYETHGRQRKGVCSTFLADRLDQSSELPVFVQTSHGFRPPANGDTPMIMVGPGTGLAPFRAFLEERRALGAKGQNWLFFGDQRASTDFLYREEIEQMTTQGALHRLDTAFSRDQQEKIYVQTRLEQHAADLWSWLEQGAHFYVCGDAKRMAKDVETSLLKVIATAGGKTPDQASEYLGKMKTDKRYQRDVY